MSEQTSQSSEEQITEILRRLEIKRSESGKDLSAPYERSEVHEVLAEHVNEEVLNYHQQPESAHDPENPEMPSYQDPALAVKVQELVDVAFTQGPFEAIAQAVKTGNLALIDALHDVLADELHPELLERQKIEPAA